MTTDPLCSRDPYRRARDAAVARDGLRVLESESKGKAHKLFRLEVLDG